MSLYQSVLFVSIGGGKLFLNCMQVSSRSIRWNKLSIRDFQIDKKAWFVRIFIFLWNVFTVSCIFIRRQGNSNLKLISRVDSLTALKFKFTLCLLFEILYSWFATTWQGGHVGGQNKRIFPRKIYMKIEFSSQRREMLLFLTTNMAAVTSLANQQYWANNLCFRAHAFNVNVSL